MAQDYDLWAHLLTEYDKARQFGGSLHWVMGPEWYYKTVSPLYSYIANSSGIIPDRLLGYPVTVVHDDVPPRLIPQAAVPVRQNAYVLVVAPLTAADLV